MAAASANATKEALSLLNHDGMSDEMEERNVISFAVSSPHGSK